MGTRDPKTGKFVKGKSGNPGGRAKGITSLIDSAISEADWKELIGIVIDMGRRGNLKAIEMLLDRRWGKPIQAISNGDEDDKFRIVVRLKDAND